MNEKLKSNDEKIASLEKLIDEKINSSVQKSVHVASENFRRLQVLILEWIQGYERKKTKQSIVSKDDNIISDISDDSKNKTKW